MWTASALMLGLPGLVKSSHYQKIPIMMGAHMQPACKLAAPETEVEAVARGAAAVMWAGRPFMRLAAG